jgi:thioredoxin reductase
VTLAEVTGLDGRDGALEAVSWRRAGEEVRRPARQLFLFIGADPNTGWLAGSEIGLDAKRFVTPPRSVGRSVASIAFLSAATCRRSAARNGCRVAPRAFSHGDRDPLHGAAPHVVDREDARPTRAGA